GPGRNEARHGPEVKERAALGELAVVESRSSDDDVGVAVAIHVARRRDGDAESGVRLIALDDPGRGGESEAGRGPQVDERPAFVELAIVESLGTDDDVAEAVAVGVARGRHGDAELGVRL